MSDNQEIENTAGLKGMFEDYFLDYASYVILERAVPSLFDGFKPVQRRILHALNEMNDGRFHKVANVIGQTMQYHPHGDAAIGDALVNLGQKDLLIDCQGNWGDVRTGDSAAAPRYIEARLTKFALDVLFNKDITDWQLSYDGRKREPINLPVKFPMVLAQGVEGIAVGLATKILPHNFIELCKQSIRVLEDKKVEIFPDFPTGGMMDASNYNDGIRGGKVRVRAHIEVASKTQLTIKSIPFSSTTSNLIDSIIKANDKGKLKVKKVLDNTAANVEIVVELPSGVSPEKTVDALYAFTDCEVSISPNACIIEGETPRFLGVSDILKQSTFLTKELLKKELEIRLNALKEKWLFSSLERIFIENRIYRDIEECETWEAVLSTIDKGLDPHKSLFFREITQDDIVRLTEIKIKRISKFDTFKAEEALRILEEEIAEVENHLAHLNDYAINHFKRLMKNYGEGKERKTEIKIFDEIDVQVVAANNVKMYVNRDEGFIGTSLKKDEHAFDCSDVDDIIAFRKNGKYMVVKVQDKAFIGKDIIHVEVWKRGDERKTFNCIYHDSRSKCNYVKRFNVASLIRDREYDVTKGNPNSKVIYFTSNPNAESELVTVSLSAQSNARKKVFDFDFGEIAIKSKTAQGNILTRHPIRKVVQKELGASSLGGRKIWLDKTVGKLNVDERGDLLGEFDTEDLILSLFNDGSYKLTNFDLVNRFDMKKIAWLGKFNPNAVISCVYLDGEKKTHYVKRFQIETSSLDSVYSFISDTEGSKALIVSLRNEPSVLVKGTKGKSKELYEEELILSELIDIKGWKAQGNKLVDSSINVKNITLTDTNTQQNWQEPNKQHPEGEQTNSFEWDDDVKMANAKPGNLFDNLDN